MKRHFKGKGDYDDNNDSSDSESKSESESVKGNQVNVRLRKVNIKHIEKKQKISKPIEINNEEQIVGRIISESEDGSTEGSSDESSNSSSSDDSSSSDGFSNKKIAFLSKTRRSIAKPVEDNQQDFKKKSISIVEKNLNRLEQNKLTDNLKNSWEYNETEIYLGLDDSDNLDPEKEYMEWKVRELNRLRRDRNFMIERETRINEMELRKKK